MSKHHCELDDVLDDALDSCRRGVCPDIESLCAEHPELADELRRLLPSLLLMERVKPESECHPPQTEERETPQQMGEYRILGEIGRGGMGVVYEAEQTSLGRRVALKMLPHSISRDKTAVRRFEREARAAARLHHTNIVPVFEVGKSGDSIYYTMQLIQGASLDAVLKELTRLHLNPSSHGRGPSSAEPRSNGGLWRDAAPDALKSRIAVSLLSSRFRPKDFTDSSARSVAAADDPHAHDVTSPANIPTAVRYGPAGDAGLATSDRAGDRCWRSVARIGFQAAEALAYLHAHGIVHRDIKPGNLILEEGGAVWVTDFGLALTEDCGVTHTGDVLGTLRYLPPERFAGKCTERSDVYSLGVTLYELLALRPAFRASDRLRLVELIRETQPVAPRKYDPRIPRDLETIVLKACEKEPENRYASAAAMAEDLQRFLADRSIKARKLSVTEKLVRWRRRNPALANSLALLVLVLMLTVVGAVVASIRESRLRRGAEQARELADGRRQDLQRTLYFAEMNLAGQASNTNGGVELIRVITDRWLGDAERRDLRGWEWFYLRSKCASNQVTVQLTDPMGFAWAPDDSRVAIAHKSGVVTVWDSGSGERRLTFRGHKSEGPGTVAWHPSQPVIASAYRTGEIRIWDAQTGESLRCIQDDRDVAMAIRWSPDGKQLAWGSRSSLKTCDPFGNSPPISLDGTPGRTNVLQWSPDGVCLFGGNWWENRGQVWNVKETEKVRDVSGRCVRWAPGGHQITHWLTADEQGQIIVWDAENGVICEHLVGHRSLVRSFDWNCDGTLLLSASQDNTVRLWDFRTGNLERVFQGHAGEVHCALWETDEQRIASSGGDGTLRFWPVRDGVDISRRGDFGLTRSVRWHPLGTFLATAHYDGSVRVWNTTDYEEIAKLPGHQPAAHSVAWSPSGRQLATCGLDGKIHIWDTSRLVEGDSGGTLGSATDAMPHLIESWQLPGVRLLEITWSPDGNRLAATGGDSRFRVWSVETARQLLFEGELAGHGNCVGWSPDGNLLAIGDRSGLVTILDGTTYDTVARFNDGSGWVVSLAFSPDQASLATSGRDDSIRIWDLRKQRVTRRLVGHQGSVWCVDWSPCGERIASCSRDGTVKVWDPLVGKEALTLSDIRPSGEIWNVAWGPKGHRLAAGCAGSTILLWDATSARQEHR